MVDKAGLKLHHLGGHMKCMQTNMIFNFQGDNYFLQRMEARTSNLRMALMPGLILKTFHLLNFTARRLIRICQINILEVRRITVQQAVMNLFSTNGQEFSEEMVSNHCLILTSLHGCMRSHNME